ncbi:hypothetical protein J1614_012236 [Plenodomus biglobosus]|nr:hypothetical protein J1614_012236 [Plenodomus biglobosus]
MRRGRGWQKGIQLRLQSREESCAEAGWSVAGLFLFNPDLVLPDVSRPPADLGSLQIASIDPLHEMSHALEVLTLLHSALQRSKDRLQERINLTVQALTPPELTGVVWLGVCTQSAAKAAGV